MKKRCERCHHPKEAHRGSLPCTDCAKTDRAELCCGYVDSNHATLVEQLAQDVLLMAASGGMPDTFWATDGRIERACEALEWTHGNAREWARKNAPRTAR